MKHLLQPLRDSGSSLRTMTAAHGYFLTQRPRMRICIRIFITLDPLAGHDCAPAGRQKLTAFLSWVMLSRSQLCEKVGTYAGMWHTVART